MVKRIYSATRWHRPLVVFAAAMTVLTVATGIGLVVDGRTLLGEPVWLKPFKFSMSFALYSVTWAWMLSFQRTARRLTWWAATVLVAASAVEMAVIVGQAARGKRSHFNFETPLDGALFRIMGVTIVVLFIGQLILGASTLRTTYADRAATTGIRLGTLIATIGLALGTLMLVQPSGLPHMIGAHSVGVPDGGPGMPITGWNSTGGDLRIPHFVGMHALQVLPLFVMSLNALARRFPLLRASEVRSRLVWVAASGYLGVVALVTWQALRGQSLIKPDALTLGAFGLIIIGVMGATVRILVSRQGTRALVDA